jgi:hypothetical protein
MTSQEELFFAIFEAATGSGFKLEVSSADTMADHVSDVMCQVSSSGLLYMAGVGEPGLPAGKSSTLGLDHERAVA